VRPEQAVRLVMLPTDQPLDRFALRGDGGHGQLPSVASHHSGIAPTGHPLRLVQTHLARPLHQQEDGLARLECKAVRVHVAVRAIRVGGQPGSPAVAARRAGAGRRDGAEVHRASSRSTDNLLAADRFEVTDAKVMRSTTAMLPSVPLGRTQRGRRKRCSDGVVQDLNDLDW
jgi:hypothetical protein